MPSGSGLVGLSLLPGPEQVPKLAVPVSIEHLNVIASPGGNGSVAWKANAGEVSAVDPLGPLNGA